MAPKFNVAPPGGSWIQMASGLAFDALRPDPRAIKITDIAHALSNVCRFGGHVREFYSVAEHCYWVSLLVPPEHALQALLHDASEAYLLDVPTPIKRSPEFAHYRKAEHRLQRMIYRRFGVAEDESVQVKSADLEMLATEARDLLAPLHPEWRLPDGVQPNATLSVRAPMSPREARAAYLERFHDLTQAKR